MTNTRAVRLAEIGGPLDEVRRHVHAATSNLLGATIAYSDEDWAKKSALPGWTRSHIAAHLCASATRMAQLFECALDGSDPPPAPSRGELNRELEVAATRNPLDLQIGLDTSAGLLASVFNDLTPELGSRSIALSPSLEVPLTTALIIRLSEVVLHHWDLIDGYTLRDVEIDPVLWILELKARLLDLDGQLPAIRLIADEGLDMTIGRIGTPVLAQAEARTLLGWITGRTAPPSDRSWPVFPIS